MVGTPKSNGCQTCRRRKKKCDERLPACTECVRAGWVCPGYDKRWKFVDENKHLVRRQRNNGASSSTESSEPSDTESRRIIARNLSKKGERRLELYEAERRGDTVCHIGIFWPLSSKTDRYATLFVSILDNDKAQALLPLKAVGSFLPLIPCRLGRNRALDAVIASLCSVYVDHLTGKTPGSSATLQKYVASLNALQQCIKDPVLRSQSETICASIIVQMCELMISPDSGRWNALNRGCALLIQDCDPKRFAAGFDRDLLDSQRNHFLTQSMHTGEQCFLARPEWRAADRVPTESAAYGSEETQMKHMLSKLLMDFPDIIRQSVDLVKSLKAHDCQRDLQRQQQRALEDALNRQLKMKQELQRWFATVSLRTKCDTTPTEPEAAPSKPPYRNLFCGIVDCIANSTLVKLDRMLLCLSRFLHSKSHGVHDLVSSPHFLHLIAERRIVAREAFVFVKATSDIGTKPLDSGLQMIATEDDLFEVPASDTFTGCKVVGLSRTLSSKTRATMA